MDQPQRCGKSSAPMHPSLPYFTTYHSQIHFLLASKCISGSLPQGLNIYIYIYIVSSRVQGTKGHNKHKEKNVMTHIHCIPFCSGKSKEQCGEMCTAKRTGQENLEHTEKECTALPRVLHLFRHYSIDDRIQKTRMWTQTKGSTHYTYSTLPSPKKT